MTAPAYRQLVGRAGPFASLWMAPDHLMLVRGEGVLVPFSEKYARYYFRDIEALFFTRARSTAAVNALLGTVAGLALLLAAAFSESGVAVGTLGSIAALLAVWLGVRLGRKPVELQIQTALGVAVIARCSRARAERAVAQVAPLIEAAQADLPPLPLVSVTAGPPPAVAGEASP